MKNALIGAVVGAALVTGGFIAFNGNDNDNSPTTTKNPFDIDVSLPIGGGDKDCADFATQREAQKFFEANSPANDPHKLDRDGDGRVCETLP